MNIMAACSRTLKENQASYFKNYRLLYVHCVAKDDFEISLAYLACVKMICREIHVSFVYKMKERGVVVRWCHGLSMSAMLMISLKALQAQY